MPKSIFPDFSLEDKYTGRIIAGVDEAGRGPLVGPIVAAAVIVDRAYLFKGVQDSKKIPAKIREKLFHDIVNTYEYSISIVSADEIDTIGIQAANIKVCTDAANVLKVKPDIVLVDGTLRFQYDNFISIVKGDTISYSIAAASIVAKVYRDRIMSELSVKYPEYGWRTNNGYGTVAHIAAIKKYGLTPLHRKSFKIKRIRGII